MRPFLLLLILIIGFASANEVATQHFNTGNNAYEKEDYSVATKEYEKAINEGVIHPVLYFNYANSLFRTDALGQSILYYEKALKLSPTDPDILANLKFAKAQTIDKHPDLEQNFVTKVLLYLHRGYSLSAALWVTLALFSLVFLWGGYSLFGRQRVKLLLYTLSAVSLIALLLMAPSVGYRIYENESAGYAIVLKESLSIRSGPGEGFEALAKVHEGTKFEIESLSKGWAKVKLPNGTGGFVAEAGLGKI